jgi:hypothetical protein
MIAQHIIRGSRRRSLAGLAAITLVALAASLARATQDVLLQTVNSTIVIGSVDDQTFSGTLGARVHSGAFNSSFLTADPGFVSLAHGNFNLPPGAEGFPALHNVNFDLLPMTTGQVSANLLYWNGIDLDANGLTAADVAFAPSVGVNWQVLDGNSTWFTADGTGAFIPGGLIQRTSSDIDPNDGVNSGAMHKHLAMRVADAGVGAPPPQGIYLVAWQVRSEGFETSDPFLLLHRTAGALPDALNLAVAWADANYDTLTSPLLPGDFDGSGEVNGNDFLTWQRNLGTPEATDLAPWRDAMAGSLQAVVTDAVPEPTTPLLAVIIFVAMASKRVQRQPMPR